MAHKLKFVTGRVGNADGKGDNADKVNFLSVMKTWDNVVVN